MPDTIEIQAPAPPPRRLGEHGGVTKGGVDMDSTTARHMILIDQMIAWQMANPGKPWTQCAAALGVSSLWCRTVASTDAYRARYAELAPELIKEIGLLPLKARISAVAEMAIERLAEKIPTLESTGDLVDATEMLLSRVYGPAQGGGDAPTSLTINQQIILEQGQRLQGKGVEGAIQPPALPGAEEPAS